MEDRTPELDVERGFYQQDINSVCNASPLLPLCSLKGKGSEIEAPYQMLQNWGLFCRNLCFSHWVQLCHFLFSPTLMSSKVQNKQAVSGRFYLKMYVNMQQLQGNQIRYSRAYSWVPMFTNLD